MAITVGQLKEKLKDVSDDIEVRIGFWFTEVETAEVQSVKINLKNQTFFCLQEQED